MVDLLARLLLVIAGFITSFFVAKDELHFQIITLVVAVFLFTLILAIMAFWPEIKKLKNRFKK